MSKKAYSSLRKLYPWPSARPLPKKDAFDWTLDGGGRELLTDVFRQRPPILMVEVGSFMGGSALRWLRENPAMRLVCVDPFLDGNADYVRGIIDAPWAANYGRDNLARYATLVEQHGTLNVVRNNLWDYRHRVVLVQGRLQDKIGDLQNLDPDISFVDAMKIREEFDILDRIFPGAIFAGDDWNWTDGKGYMPIPDFTGEVATRRGGEIYAKACTFVVNEPRFGLELPAAFRYKTAA